MQFLKPDVLHGQEDSWTTVTMRCVGLNLWCCCNLAVVIGQLRPVVKENNEHEYILQIISKYDDFMHYKNFITFVGDLDVGEGDKIVPSIEYRIMETFGRPLIVAGSATGFIYDSIGIHNLAVAIFRGMHDPLLYVVQKALCEMKLIPVLFVYKSKSNLSPTTDLIEVFLTGAQKSTCIIQY